MDNISILSYSVLEITTVVFPELLADIQAHAHIHAHAHNIHTLIQNTKLTKLTLAYLRRASLGSTSSTDSTAAVFLTYAARELPTPRRPPAPTCNRCLLHEL